MRKLYHIFRNFAQIFFVRFCPIIPAGLTNRIIPKGFRNIPLKKEYKNTARQIFLLSRNFIVSELFTFTGPISR
ncbi:hypothetical protein ANACOL_03265 [Anaerotruncus colihominis DSM 17241]|jgi:hypothetical protein|uniref:Uncharacterized protein n=1 Tax=Anaerotruncus colihominis DSM 17241 TaxID=445972 RepID=B0PEN8_9FIRM|nr:hypothetical protein ANACOL_03265 [Anaerotruncus colihominis DSM 17241]